jgi:hypothetical protein
VLSRSEISSLYCPHREKGEKSSRHLALLLNSWSSHVFVSIREMSPDTAPGEMPAVSNGESTGYFSPAELDSYSDKVTHELEGSTMYDGSNTLVDQKFEPSQQQLAVPQSETVELRAASPIMQTPLGYYGTAVPGLAPVVANPASDAQ